MARARDTKSSGTPRSPLASASSDWNTPRASHSVAIVSGSFGNSASTPLSARVRPAAAAPERSPRASWRTFSRSSRVSGAPKPPAAATAALALGLDDPRRIAHASASVSTRVLSRFRLGTPRISRRICVPTQSRCTKPASPAAAGALLSLETTITTELSLAIVHTATPRTSSAAACLRSVDSASLTSTAPHASLRNP